MVYLNRIYTKSGDRGETSLGDGSRVPKTDPRIVASGVVDELNSSLGVAIAVGQLNGEILARLSIIQNDLFDLGADLSVPRSDDSPSEGTLQITEAQVQQLEEWIDLDVARLEPLSSFILPGGTAAAACLHLSRTICRRSEVEAFRLAATEAINPYAIQYLNRLSDLLFVMARMANDGGRADVLWVPGGKRGDSIEDSRPSQ